MFKYVKKYGFKHPPDITEQSQHQRGKRKDIVHKMYVNSFRGGV
jgi:hypothetical protein